MPDRPALAGNCPDPDCNAAIGEPHLMGCDVAICVMTGNQRILHADEPPAAVTADLAGLPFDVDAHICGEDVWTGWRHGVTEATEHDLFVRMTPTGWMPCPAGLPGAVPDLDRVVRSGAWNAIRQLWEMPAGVPGRG